MALPFGQSFVVAEALAAAPCPLTHFNPTNQSVEKELWYSMKPC